MAERGAATATMTTKNVVESVMVRAPPPPPPSFSSSKSPGRRIGGGGCCGLQSRCSKRFFSQNNGNFERSAVPSRFMYYRNSIWVNFSADVVETLRTGFLERRPIVEAWIDGAKYIFDLKRMLQIDYLTGNCRSISWIDENGKCFFPNDFFSEEEVMESAYGNEKDHIINYNYKNKNSNCNPKIEIEVKTDRASLKRKREEEPEVSSSCKAVGAVDVIKHQRLKEGGAAKWPNTKLLRETERAYVLVKDHILNGIRKVDAGVTITSIHQCMHEGHLNKARLEVFQKQIEITKAARGTSNLVYAWYGASAKVVESILAHGFGMPSKVPTTVYGIGVYLSPVGFPHLSAKLANADNDGIKHLILCRVILGNVEKVEAGSQQYHPSSLDFDTASDDPKNPEWYVVWSTNANMHILPESVVSFRPSSNMQGQPRPLPGVKYSLEKLFSKIKSSLPPAKVQEIWISYTSYKAGTLAKDAFISQLRLVAGDEVLRSAILEINASG
ncbi:probable inactive poly [ADP-ribose] polymerase SRO3 isoform X1 [Durio zibethinus]|uniref:Probable inactive poly [ADP-ribose] polymerase SRO3 isoform X1 n=1 Tax=Durio zibethinus TaxID=66656 RepID=A0A6P6AUI7_DURZI|nr:probable inactive poly [ADP-ribose] polymerase SRO3 isoform X1 [Durio zibethinus]